MAGLEEASDPNAELWLGGEMAVAFGCDERLHLRIEPRPDGKPRLIVVASLALALDNAARQIVER
jgi:hypothetical protein